MDLKKYSDGILKTGFVLENKIAQTLNSNGWTVISNKYYEDDFEDKIREIDLLAYKVSRVQDFDVYTCLIISCKQNISNIWALLCRDINLKDPNSDFWPLHYWSNKLSIKHQLSLTDKPKEYYRELIKIGVKEVLSDPNVDIFAFQEMDSVSGSPKNDKAIYDSITSLIKAQAYEMSALPERKKAPSVYQFNLLSVVDADIIRLKFKGDEISPASTTSEHFVSRYILKKKQSFSRIRFLNASIFDKSLNDYSQLHKANSKWFDKLCNDFYINIENDNDRIKVYIDEFRAELRLKFFLRFYQLFNKTLDSKNIDLDWDAGKKSLVVDFFAENGEEDILNNDDIAKKIVGTALLKVYRYEGLFHFGTTIPF